MQLKPTSFWPFRQVVHLRQSSRKFSHNIQSGELKTNETKNHREELEKTIELKTSLINLEDKSCHHVN